MNPSAPAPNSPEPAGAGVFTPEVFGKYFLVDKIAMGGMAEIFKAKTFGHGGFENLVVIKRILSHLSANDQFVRMFMDEAKVSVLLQNANIVRIYDFGKIRENYFIAMECVEGKDAKLILRKLAERRKLLPREFERERHVRPLDAEPLVEVGRRERGRVSVTTLRGLAQAPRHEPGEDAGDPTTAPYVDLIARDFQDLALQLTR